MRQLHVDAEFRRPGVVRDGIRIAIDRTGNRQIRILQDIASPGVVDVLPLARVPNASGCREPRRQSNRRLSEHGATHSVDPRVEPALEWSRRLIAPDGLVIRFAEEKHATDPGQSGLLVRDRDLLRELTLELELMRPYQVEFAAVGVRDEFVVEVSIRGQADQGGGGRQSHGQTGARAVVQRVIPTEYRRANVVEIGGVVELISRLCEQDLVVGQRNSGLVVDVTRQQQVRPPIEHHAQLTARGGDIIAAKRVVQMFEVADETVPDATFERDRPHHSVAFQRPAHPRVRAKLSEVAGGDTGGRLEVIGGRPGNEVHRPADGVPPIQRALRPSKHFDAIQIEKPRERHRGPGEIHAVEIDRRTRIRSGKHGVRPDPADRELAPAGVLRKRH